MAKNTRPTYLIWIILGWFFVLLGAVGIVLPLLPTTPFLLLAAGCFSRGSPRFQKWLLDHPVLGPPVRDWQRNHVIRTQHKTLATITIALASGVVLAMQRIPDAGKIAYSVVIACVLVFIWTRKSR